MTRACGVPRPPAAAEVEVGGEVVGEVVEHGIGVGIAIELFALLCFLVLRSATESEAEV